MIPQAVFKIDSYDIVNAWEKNLVFPFIPAVK
jgi:hypothetical protein